MNYFTDHDYEVPGSRRHDTSMSIKTMNYRVILWMMCMEWALTEPCHIVCISFSLDINDKTLQKVPLLFGGN